MTLQLISIHCTGVVYRCLSVIGQSRPHVSCVQLTYLLFRFIWYSRLFTSNSTTHSLGAVQLLIYAGGITVSLCI